MLLFLANVSPSFLRELPPVEINKGHPSEKAKSGSSQRELPPPVFGGDSGQAEDWGALWWDPWVGKIPLEEGMATHSSILAWRIPMDKGAWWLQPVGSQRVGHD